MEYYTEADLNWEYANITPTQRANVRRVGWETGAALGEFREKERVPFVNVLGGENRALPSGANVEDYANRSLLADITHPYRSAELGDVILPRDTYDAHILGGDTYYNTASEFPAKLYFGIDGETEIHTALQNPPDLGKIQGQLRERVQLQADTSLIRSGTQFIPTIPIQANDNTIRFIDPLDQRLPENQHRNQNSSIVAGAHTVTVEQRPHPTIPGRVVAHTVLTPIPRRPGSPPYRNFLSPSTS